MLHAVKSVAQAEPVEPESASSGARQLTALSGATAEIHEAPEGEHIQVCDPDGALIFDYHPASGRSVINVPRGDLSVQTEGWLNLVGAKGVRVASAGEVSVESATGVRAGVTKAGRFAGLRVFPTKAAMVGRTLALIAEHASLDLMQTRYRGRTLDAKAEQLQLNATKMETVAERIVTRAKTLLQKIDDLHQLRVGRIHAVARDAIDIRGRTASLVTEQELRLDGEKIHLG